MEEPLPGQAQSIIWCCLCCAGCKVTLAGGETMSCKVLVGADGSYSKARLSLVSQESCPEV